MSNTKYTFDIDQFLNNKVDLTKLDGEIKSSDITVALDYISSEETYCDCFFKSVLPSKELTTLSGIVALHDGVDDGLDDITYVSIKSSDIHLPVDIKDEYRDRSGKLRVHQTSRKIGTVIVWTGIGDDTSNISSVGGGERFSFAYKQGQNDPLVKHIDFNIVENETWLHEGYVTWKDCELDTLDLMVVPRVTSTTSGTNYNLYGGYLIIPAVPGTGTIDIVSDITDPNGGLVHMPNNDLDEPPLAFWNADWNSTTKKYENITPAPSGDGSFNMFNVEVILAHFVRKLSLLHSGFIALNSSDTDQLGQGMRLKMIADTNIEDSVSGDHDWSVACTLCLHREKTV